MAEKSVRLLASVHFQPTVENLRAINSLVLDISNGAGPPSLKNLNQFGLEKSIETLYYLRWRISVAIRLQHRTFLHDNLTVDAS